ncbi:MAG: CDP-diacylglycerol--serine O-phosphatidyltransferase [Opitutaceae bacterium]|nr:CDP-diacylglycerol--serine O-phosphatidyltransferase [Cytophagales bacterium]
MRLFTIPNLVTLANLLSGLFGIVFCFHNKLDYACYCIYFAALFDFLDGFVARLFKSSSELGKQLDSLCDIVSFGVLPGFIMYSTLLQYKEISFVVPVFSALRLAKFNIDQRQSDGFIGVPTPINAFFLTSIFFTFSSKVSVEINYILLGFIMFSSVLLVSEIPLMSLKFKNVILKENIFKFILIALSLILLPVLKLESFIAIYFIYILLSVINNFTNRNNVVHS